MAPHSSVSYIIFCLIVGPFTHHLFLVAAIVLVVVHLPPPLTKSTPSHFPLVSSGCATTHAISSPRHANKAQAIPIGTLRGGGSRSDANPVDSSGRPVFHPSLWAQLRTQLEERQDQGHG